jgi:hypothetical protein
MILFFSLGFVKKYELIQAVIGIIRATPIPAQKMVMISAPKIFELTISSRV